MIRSTRERHAFELALEWAFKRAYPDIRDEALRMRACSETDLLNMGRQLVVDMGRLAAGQISSINVPRRYPRPGEFDPIPA